MTPVLRSVAIAAALSLIAASSRAEAQRATAGVQMAFAEYAEQGPDLRFGGGGVAGHVSLSWNRFSLHLAGAAMELEPRESSGSAAEPFDMTQTDVRLRVRATRMLSVDLGFMNREITPEHAAQSVGAVRIGTVLAFPLAASSAIEVRTAYLAGSKFSGGGSAPFGIELGLGAAHGVWRDRVRLTADLDFQRLDRRTENASGRLDSPIQGSVGRLGMMVAY
jgi:hypothetical protein